MDNDKRVFEYEGGFYARPVYRGISLDDLRESGSNDLEEIIYDLLGPNYSRRGHCKATIRIRVEVMDLDPVPDV